MTSLALILTTLSPQANAAPVELSLYAPYGLNPGLRLGTTVPVGGAFIRPHVAGFGRSDNHIAGMVGVDAGVRLQRDGRRRYSTLAIGADYLATAQIVSESVDLATGERTPTRQLQHAVVPTLSAELGWERDGLDFFGRVSAGWKVGADATAYAAFEIGTRFGGM